MDGTGSVPDELPVGRRVAYWRDRRGYTQQVFADRLGRSKSWVDKVERGARALDRYSVLQEIAAVLEIDVKHLLSTAPATGAAAAAATSGASDRIEVDAVRAALERYVPLAGRLDAEVAPPPLPELRKAVDHGWLAFQHGGYPQLCRSLPRQLRDAQSAEAYHRTGDAVRQSAHLLAQSYQLASSLLRKLGEYGLAWLAADRSMSIAGRAGDPLLAGTAACRAGNALLVLGRPRPALEVHLTVANRLAPGGADAATPERLSVFGMLLLQGAMAAAHLGDECTVRELFREAGAAAVAVGTDQNHYWTSFGPTNVALHRIAADVELGEGRRAVETYRCIDLAQVRGLAPERRAQQLLDLARAHAQIGETGRAERALLDAERLAPAEIRHRPVAHRVVADLVRASRRSHSAKLAQLADRMGVHPS